MKIQAKSRLQSRRSQEWFDKLESKNEYLRKYPKSKFRTQTRLICPEKGPRSESKSESQ